MDLASELIWKESGNIKSQILISKESIQMKLQILNFNQQKSRFIAWIWVPGIFQDYQIKIIIVKGNISLVAN